MNLINIVNIIKQVSIEYPTVQCFAEGDIYQYLNSGEHKYPCVFLTIESISGSNINATLFFVDRLLDDNTNKLDIQTVGITALKGIIERIQNDVDYINFNATDYTPFTEQFSDLCAGVFVRCNINITDDVECADDFAKITLTVRENGVYDLVGYSQVLVVIPKEIGVKSLGGKQGKIRLGGRLTINDDNVLSLIEPEFVAGDNIEITKTENGYEFSVPNMRYDDTEIQETLAEINSTYDEIISKINYIYAEQEKMFYDILITRFNGKKIEA